MKKAIVKTSRLADRLGLTVLMLCGSLSACSSSGQELVMQIQAVRAIANPQLDGPGYFVSQVVSPVGEEHRLYLHDHHFLSVIEVEGAISIRARPGADWNGWGTSWYPQSFTAGAVLKHSVVDSVTAGPGGVAVALSGKVSHGPTATFGDWSLSMEFQYQPDTKSVVGSGTYGIVLDGLLAETGLDLSAAKLASNFLEDVWLLDGAIDNTGDMTTVHVERNGIPSEVWTPTTNALGHFPGNETDSLSMEIVGAWNQVDVPRQDGVHPIQAANKPTVLVEYSSSTPLDGGLRFGALYSVDVAQDYTADNIGITPLIFRTSSQTSFSFNVTFASSARPTDGKGIEATLTATALAGNPDAIDIFYADSLTGSHFRRFVGELQPVTAGHYRGHIYVPNALVTEPVTHGFFRAMPH